MLDVRTQSMDANFYSNIERGRGEFFSNIWDQDRGHIVLEIFPAPPFNIGCTNAIDGREFLLQH